MQQYFSFQWHITDECDQRCKHCYIFSGEGCTQLKSMTYTQMQEVIANCEDFCRVYHRLPYFISLAEILSCILTSGNCWFF